MACPWRRCPTTTRPGTYLVVVGRISPEKGIAEAVQLAARSGIPLRIAAKVHRPDEHELFESLVRPAIDAGSVEFLGELQAGLRDPLLAGALATLMLGSWPEPFGLVAIELLATGTPVIARHAGALPEIIEPGVDGFLVDDVAEAELALQRVAGLDRALIRERALARFSTDRMTTEYEAVYERVLAARRSSTLQASRSGFREPDAGDREDARSDPAFRRRPHLADARRCEEIRPSSPGIGIGSNGSSRAATEDRR